MTILERNEIKKEYIFYTKRNGRIDIITQTRHIHSFEKVILSDYWQHRRWKFNIWCDHTLIGWQIHVAIQLYLVLRNYVTSITFPFIHITKGFSVSKVKYFLVNQSCNFDQSLKHIKSKKRIYHRFEAIGWKWLIQQWLT